SARPSIYIAITREHATLGEISERVFNIAKENAFETRDELMRRDFSICGKTLELACNLLIVAANRLEQSLDDGVRDFIVEARSIGHIESISANVRSQSSVSTERAHGHRVQ